MKQTNRKKTRGVNPFSANNYTLPINERNRFTQGSLRHAPAWRMRALWRAILPLNGMRHPFGVLSSSGHAFTIYYKYYTGTSKYTIYKYDTTSNTTAASAAGLLVFVDAQHRKLRSRVIYGRRSTGLDYTLWTFTLGIVLPLWITGSTRLGMHT